MSEVLHGNASGDQLNVSSDKTQAYGLSGNDTLTSDGKSNVLLVGGSGNDSLIMKGGNGTLSGGAGNDIFELNYSATEKISAVIEDLEPTEDKIVVNFEGNAAPQLISLTSGEDSLTSGKDVIWRDEHRQFNITIKSVRENDYFDGTAPEQAWEVLKLTNDEREKRNRSQWYFPWDNHSQENLPWLTMSEGLMNAASIRAQEITKLGGQSAFENHNRPDGKGEYKTIFDEAEVNKHYSDYGENLDAGAQSAAGVMDDWINSPHHRENILDEKNLNFQKLGVGYNENPEDPTHRVHYWTQLFASNLIPEEMETVSTENLLTAIPQVNTVSNLFVTLSDDPDTYTNSAFGATIAALGGNDSITNLSPMVSISGGNDNDTIDNQFGSDVTINAGAGDDSINFGSRVRRNLIQYQAGDGSDTISGLHSTDTLSISGGEYTPVTLGKDVVISVGAHSITVSDAPKNFSIDGTQSNFFFLTEGNDNFSNTVDGATIEVLSGEAKITNSGASVTIKGGALDDTITNSGASVTISAGTGNDSLVNKAENVLFVYEGGFDTVRGFDESSTLKIPSKIFSSLQSGRNDLILTSPDVTGSIKLLNVRKLDKLNILDADNNPIEIGKADSIFGTDEADNLTNSSDEMIIQAYAGDDTISNSGDMVSINGGDDNDQIQNEGSGVSIVGSGGADSISDSGDSNSISGGTGDDTIKISGNENTINAGTGNDSISVAGSRNVIEYASGDGSDTISGLNEDDTLSISGDNYTSTKSGSDVVVTVGKGKISLVGAANLTKLNIDGTSSSAATVSSSIPSDALKYNGHSYKIFDEGMTWEEAKAYCELLGGHLVVITDANEQAAVQSLIKSKGTKSNYWLGGFKNSSSTSSKLITLTEGDDTHSNTIEGATILALGGNDTIYNYGASVSIDGSADNDTITNSGSNVTISGGDGNDSVWSYFGNNVTIDSGLGNDSIDNWGDSVTIDGGAGEDSISNRGSRVSISGGADNDSIINTGDSVTINSGAGNDSIRNINEGNSISGGDGDDTISSIVYGTLSSGLWNTIDAGLGDDYISLGGGHNQIIYNAGDGSDTITGLTSNDTINIFGSTYTRSTISSDVVLSVGEDSIRLVDAAGLSFNINGTLGADPKLITLTEDDDTYENTIEGATILALGGNDSIYSNANNVSISGAAGNDSIYNAGGESSTLDSGIDDDYIYNAGGELTSINSGDGNDSIYNNSNNVTIDGGAGNDSIRNYVGPSSSNITINAGDGDDTVNLGYYDSNVTVNGGTGNDQVSLGSGGSGNVFVYNSGDGDDTIRGFNATSTLSISGATYSTTTSGSDVIVSVGENSIRLINAAGLTLNIENDTTPANVADDTTTPFEALDPTEVIMLTTGDDSLYNTVEGAEIQALAGEDTINNNEANVIIYGGDDDDTLRNHSEGFYSTINGDAGDDYIDNYGASSTIDGGTGNDTIANWNYTSNVTINGGAGIDSIINGGNSVTISGGAGDDSIRNVGDSITIDAGADDDYIENWGANVSIDSGDGNDTISLGSAASVNLIQYTSGDGNDTIQGFNATSTLSISGAEYSTTTSGNDVIVTVGDGSIRLIDAATLSALNIEGTINSSSGDGSWQWVTGETWSYDNWGYWEPNNHNGTENVLMIYKEQSPTTGDSLGYWNDINSDGTSYDDNGNYETFYGKENFGLICEWETVPSKLIKLTENADTYSESMESGTTLKALGGDDYILSHSGYVLIEGGTGNDTLQNYVDDETSSSYATILGGAGDDSIENHGSHASIEGGVGNDTIWNNDDEAANYATILGGIGQDAIYNYGASSIIDGGKGDDSIENHASNVSINSGAGNNYIQNGDGYGTTLAVNVTINTGEGNNTVRNWSTNLFVNMGSGDDSIYNDGANATLNGGAGNDSISNFNSSVYVNGGEGNDTLLNGSGWDGSNNFITKNATLNGGAGNDSIWNDSNNSTIAGGAGSDTIDNHGKNTTIIGGKDNDEINLASDSKNNFVQYFMGDGNDIVWGINKSDTVNILMHDSKTMPKGYVSSVLSGNDIIYTIGKGTDSVGTITLKDAKDKRPHIILGESGSSGGGSGGSGGGSSGGGGGGGSSGGTSGSAGSNSAASASNSASGNSGTSSSNGGSSGRGNNTVVTRQTVVNFEQPPSPNGNQIISNYQSGEKLHFNADYSGALFDSKNNFFAGFSTGAIIVPNAMDKVIDIRDNSDNQLIKAYAASKPGVIDGRRLGGFEIIKGSAGADEIYSGRGGAQMIGGAGNDTLTGWKGVDIFITGKTQGSDLIRNSSVLDKVNLTDINWSDVVSTSENGNSVILRFNSGNSITVESSEALSSTFMFADGSARCYNYSTKSWQTMKESAVNGTPKIYEGGSQSISSYKSGERIIFNADYKGGSYDGAGNFSVNSSKGMLVVQNAMDKVIDLRNGANNPIIKAYAASKPGTIDGRNIAGFELINGSSGADVICAGDGGSQLWGGAGDAADVLIGGDGADVFIGGRTQGADLIQNASSADTVNFNDATLADIVATSENNGAISLAFNTGNVINVQSSETMSAKFTLADGSSYRYNHSRKTWQSA